MHFLQSSSINTWKYYMDQPGTALECWINVTSLNLCSHNLILHTFCATYKTTLFTVQLPGKCQVTPKTGHSCLLTQLFHVIT